MDFDKTILESAGLTTGESKVYLALLKTGQSSTGNIVKEAEVTTSKSYKILARLEKKGLVSHIIKNNVKQFKAASPKHILDLIQKEKEILTEKETEIQKIIPQLLAYQELVQKDHEVEVYQGIKGLQTLFTEQTDRLKEEQPLYVIGVTHYEKYDKTVAEFFRRLQAKRDQKKIRSNFILGDDAKGSLSYLEKSKFCQTYYIPYASAVSINIYLDTTIIAIFVGEPILIKISSQDVADNFLKHFELLANLSSK